MQSVATGPVKVDRDWSVLVTYRARASYNISVDALLMNERGEIHRRTIVPQQATGTTTFARTDLTQGLFGEPEWLLSAVVNTDSFPTVARDLWVEVRLQNGGTDVAILARGYLHAGNRVCWPAVGVDDREQQGAVLAGDYTIVSQAAAGAGDHVYLITVASGSRLRVRGGRILNGDTASRTAIVQTERSADTDPVQTVLVAAIAPGGSAQLTGRSTSSDTYYGMVDGNDIVLGAGDKLRVTLASVADGENSQLTLHAELWGPPPTVTFTAPGTETTTSATVVSD